MEQIFIRIRNQEAGGGKMISRDLQILGVGIAIGMFISGFYFVGIIRGWWGYLI